MDHETLEPPVWRPGSKRPSATGPLSSSYSSRSKTGATGSGLDTVSNRVPALRVFLLIGVGAATLHFLTYLSLRSEFENSVAFVSGTSGRAHTLVLLSYVVQAFAVVNLLVFLALLLSRSFATVRMLLAVALVWSALNVILAIVLKSSVTTVWALATALYVGNVFTRVGRAQAAESFSDTDNGDGYSPLELALAGYMIILTIATGLVTFNLHSTTTAPSSSGQSIITYANGSSGGTPGIDSAPSAYVEQTVSAHDFKVSLNFDPDSTATVNYFPLQTVGGSTNPGIDAIDINGNLLHTTTEVVITVQKEGAAGAITMDPRSCQTAGGVPSLNFKATIMGQPTSVCGVLPKVLTLVNAGGVQYQLVFSVPQLADAAAPTTSAALQAIATSIKIQ
jgi:hypothetical protein